MWSISVLRRNSRCNAGRFKSQIVYTSGAWLCASMYLLCSSSSVFSLSRWSLVFCLCSLYIDFFFFFFAHVILSKLNYDFLSCLGIFCLSLIKYLRAWAQKMISIHIRLGANHRTRQNKHFFAFVLL